MSLSPEQQKELKKLAQELNKIEQISVENSLDLDVFVTHFPESVFASHSKDDAILKEKALGRKKAFGQNINQQTAAIKSK